MTNFLAPNQLVSHQAYSDAYNRKRVIGIEENDDQAITHYVHFELNEHLQLLARIKHNLGNSRLPETLTLKENQIRYQRKGVSPHEAVPLTVLPERDEVISKIAQRAVVIVAIEIDKKYYRDLTSTNRVLTLENQSFILMAPDPALSKPKIPLKVEEPCNPPSLDESVESQGSRAASLEEEEQSLLPKRTLHLTPDVDS